jgi:hypothetical protein
MTDEFEEKDTTLISDNGHILPAKFRIWDVDPEDRDKVKISLVFAERQMVRSETDYFSALRSIRVELEKEGLKINCYGGSKNVYPTPMSLDMGAGANAFRWKLGEQPTAKDIVWIFDSGPDVIPATVEEQNAFFEQWTKSIT